MKPVFIYALKEPDTGEIRYIGKTNSPKKRFDKHISETKQGKARSHKIFWIRSLLSRGQTPIFEILDEVSFEHWQQLEAAYIEFFREHGCDLVNTSEGGLGGGLLGRACLPGTREKISASLKGGKLSPEHRANISAAQTGKKHSPEHNKAYSQGRLLAGKPKLLEILKLTERGMTTPEISTALGVTEESIRTFIVRRRESFPEITDAIYRSRFEHRFEKQSRAQTKRYAV